MSNKTGNRKEAEHVVPVTDRRRALNLDEPGQTPGADPPEAGPSSSIEALRAQLRDREAKLQRIQARAEAVEQQMRAEIHEAGSRLEKNFEQRVAAAKSQFVQELLSVFDNLDLTVQAAEQGSSVEQLLDGVQTTRRLLHQALQRHGIERLEVLGQPFDPARHEAVETLEVPTEQAGLVVKQLRAGYRLHEQLLRPALVCVGQEKRGMTDDG